MFKTKKDPNLAKIIVVIVVVGVVTASALRLHQWYKEDYLGGQLQATAHTDLGKARQLVEQGRFTEAKALLEPIVDRVNDDRIIPEALMLLAQVERDTGNKQRALGLLKRAKVEFPDSPDQPRVAIAYGRLLEDVGRSEEAVSVYESVREDTSPRLRAPALTGLGRKAEQDGDLKAARDLYRQAVREAEWGGDAWNEALDALGRANVAVIFSPEDTPESKVCVVEKGDNLTDIGIKLNTTQGMLMRANGIEDPAKLWPGQRLKYTPKDFQIVIERATCRVFLLDKDGIFKRYYVGLGKKGHETTPGMYKIGDKQKDPVWHKRGEEPIPPGDPRNELGTRWMPLVPVEEGLPLDLGIHGTVKPETVGTYASMGCARLIREDVEELYDLVVRSTPVRIVDALEPKEVQ